MNPRVWRAYRRTLCLCRSNLSGPEKAMSVLKVRNAVRLEYLRYENAEEGDLAQLVEVHEKVNAFLEWWWDTWEDPIENPLFKSQWRADTRHMDETQAKNHYASLLSKRAEGMREFNTHIDALLESRPPVPPSPWQTPTPAWRTP
eukprot:TRINITY_DN48422_c0_g1_i1.p1 TRINITY_DN48422_c0_g1~~TRINITY_DN48422_c0_g1_i1.p1  ORF type:complete len:145 (+),score=37.36 TRINITY_DN48422_c0_g1_i1:53-487(+)